MINKSKAVVLFLCMSLIMTIFSKSIVFAAEEKSSQNAELTQDEVLESFYLELLAQNEYIKQFEIGPQDSATLLSGLQERTLRKLSNLGLEAYLLNDDSFDSLERDLKMDLSFFPIEEGHSYYLIIDQNKEGERSSISDTYQYTYNGTTYSIRYVTFTPADNSLMSKADSVILGQSSISSIISNILDYALYYYVSTVFPGGSLIGAIGSMLGISASMIKASTTFTATLNGGANWTRIYTQVWDDSYQSWYNGCFAEKVLMDEQVSGKYFSTATNSWITKYHHNVWLIYSNYFQDYTWRRQSAVLGYLNSYCIPDTTGNACFRRDNTTVLTFYENF